MVGELTDLRMKAPWTSEEVTVPVLAVRGALGADHHRRGMRFVSEEIASARLHVVAGAHHYAPNTHPDEIAGLVDELRSSVGDTDRDRSDHQ